MEKRRGISRDITSGGDKHPRKGKRMIDDYITLKEWAEAHGIHPDTARQRALRGAFTTAKKIGNLWVIKRDEPLTDHRRKGDK